VVEAAGYDASRAQAIEAVRYNGRVGYFGYPERSGLVPFPFETAWRKCCSIEIVAGTQSEPGLRSFREAVDAIHDGRVQVDHLLTSRYPLIRFPEAFQAARERRAVKVIVDV
jgi:L-iditol 2-dehydrogenase